MSAYVCPYSDAELREASHRCDEYQRRQRSAEEMVSAARKIAGGDEAMMMAGISFSIGDVLTPAQLRNLSDLLRSEAHLKDLVAAKEMAGTKP